MTDSEKLSKITQDIGKVQGTVESLAGSVNRFIERAERQEGETRTRCEAHGSAIAENRSKIRGVCRDLSNTKDDLREDVKDLSKKSGLKAGAVSGAPGSIAFIKMIVDAVRDAFSGG